MSALKRIGRLAALLPAMALCLLGAPALAVDFSYTGELEPVTGAPVASSEAAEINRVWLSDEMYYDGEARLYAYPVGSGLSEVRASVADGMIVSEPVTVSASDGLSLTVYRDGTELEKTELEHIDTVGQYAVSARDGDITRKLFTFQIVGERTNLVGGYPMPESFFIMNATLDGEETYYERAYIGMEDEGTYQIEYVCPETGIHYTLETTVDHTPPEITLDGRIDEQGRYHSEVQVGGLQSGDSVAMTRDGESVRFPANGKLTESGVYTLEVTDGAGNSAYSRFTILMYFDINSLIFFALVCLSLAGVLGYVLYKRKKLKVG